MNGFAHAWLAATRSQEPWFWLAAMLPDWRVGVGGRLARVDHATLAAGVRFHHRSDAAFHASRRFAALLRDASARLRVGGRPAGPARAAAHVGVELLLDAALAAAPGGGDALRRYRSALAAAPDASAHLAWSGSGSAWRFRRVAAALLRSDLPRADADAARVAAAVARTLAWRPRLRLAPASLPVLEAWAHGARDDVARAAPTLLAETEAGLRAREAP